MNEKKNSSDPLNDDLQDLKEGNSSSCKSFDDILTLVGPQGRYQWKVFTIASFCGLFTAMQSLSAAFLGASPDFMCIPTNGSLSGFENNNSWSSDPLFGKSFKCEYPILNDSHFTWDDYNHSLHVKEDVEMQQCSRWLYDDSIYETTVVTEWDLVCDKDWLVPIIQATFMIGVLVGAVILSELSDMYGRRTISVTAAFGSFIVGVASAFSTNLTMFLILKFGIGFFSSGLFLPNFVLIMEMLGNGCRTSMGVLYQFFFAVGFAILPGIAYFVRDWRNLTLAISIPSVILLSYIWILPESPRWLMLQGRHKEALKILGDMAKMNGGCLPDDIELENIVDNTKNEKKHSKSIIGRIAEFFKNQAILVRTPILRRRCLIIFFGWFTVAMVYYGLSFSGENINASVYLMVFLAGIVELPALIFASWTVQRFGRRLNLVVCFYTCGVACILILLVPKGMVWLNMTLATIGKFFDSIAFSIVYIYSAELVPTGVRNIAVGTSSLCARIGGSVAPFIVKSLGKVHYAIPSTVFGILSVIAGSLILLLPETGNMSMPETIQEVEKMKK